MTKCDETRARMTFYLDDELEASECAVIKDHLDNCESCRKIFGNEQRFLTMIRESRPLNVASPELRARVENVVTNPPVAPLASHQLHRRIQRSLWHLSSRAQRQLSSRQAIGLAFISCIALALGYWALNTGKPNPQIRPPSDFAVMAADTHQRHLQGQLPLEIVSGVPEQISRWFAGKVSFLVKLPNYQESSGQEKLYQLEGARLVGYKSDYAAYVAYQMRTRPISLVVTSDAVARPADGEQIVARGITFHYNSIKGLKVITWSDRGLTYALVSDLEERGQQSCLVCHQGTKDRDFIESLKPR
jgi:mycothiol system anti-sigma-R factor